jgi:DNA repair protein REV1
LVAKYLKPPLLKKKSSLDDLQELIMGWVDAGSDTGPEEGEVDKVAKYVVACVEGEIGFAPAGLENAVGLMKWWQHLCRSRWADSEPTDLRDDTGAEARSRWEDMGVGARWWSAFADVKLGLDAIVGKRFGGRLRL